MTIDTQHHFVNSFEPFGGLRGSKGSGSSVNKWSDSSHGNVRKSRDSITRSRDNSPEIEKYANQMRRLKRELNQRKPKTIKQLEKMPLTSTEETHLIKNTVVDLSQMTIIQSINKQQSFPATLVSIILLRLA
jgi:hypothetical protein